MPRVGRGWRVTVRDGPRVSRQRADSLETALDLVERAGRELAAGPGRGTVDLHVRSFTPQQQGAGGGGLSGPRVYAGGGGRGGGAAGAWVGRIARRGGAPAGGEKPLP